MGCYGIFDRQGSIVLEWQAMRRLGLFLGWAVLGGVAQSQMQGQTRPAITGIAFARMYAADGVASEKFYKGLGYVPEAVGGTTRYPVSDVQWLEVMPLPAPTPRSRLAAVGLMTRDAAGMERYLRAKGVPIDEPLRDGRFGVRDPEGNQIVFVQAGSQRLNVVRKQDPAASARIIHAGFAVKSAAAEDAFYHEVLGFKPYWHGGQTESRTDWVSLQVPEGSDWLEYMLNMPADANARQRGVMDHFSLGVNHMDYAVTALARTGCEGANCMKTQMGRDGKVQLNVFDPDLTRVEYMEFKASGVTCCSPITGKVPGVTEER